MKKEEKELVIVRLQTLPPHKKLCINDTGYSRDEIIKEVENETVIGELVVRIHMKFLKSLTNEELHELLNDENEKEE